MLAVQLAVRFLSFDSCQSLGVDVNWSDLDLVDSSSSTCFVDNFILESFDELQPLSFLSYLLVLLLVS